MVHRIMILSKLIEIVPDLINKFKPDFIFYLSGVDVLKNDKLGRLSLSINGCKKRDEIIISLCKKETFQFKLVCRLF